MAEKDNKRRRGNVLWPLVPRCYVHKLDNAYTVDVDQPLESDHLKQLFVLVQSKLSQICLLHDESLECVKTGKDVCSVIQWSHALSQAPNRASQYREMGMNDSRYGRIGTSYNALGKLCGHRNLVKDWRGAGQGDSRHHLMGERVLIKNSSPPGIVCLKGSNCLGNQLRLRVAWLQVLFVLLNK